MQGSGHPTCNRWMLFFEMRVGWWGFYCAHVFVLAFFYARRIVCIGDHPWSPPKSRAFLSSQSFVVFKPRPVLFPTQFAVRIFCFQQLGGSQGTIRILFASVSLLNIHLHLKAYLRSSLLQPFIVFTGCVPHRVLRLLSCFPGGAASQGRILRFLIIIDSRDVCSSVGLFAFGQIESRGVAGSEAEEDRSDDFVLSPIIGIRFEAALSTTFW